MLKIVVPPQRGFDEDTLEFVQIGEPIELVLEHSLESIAEWESIWEMPFLGDSQKTDEQLRSYIKCMTLNEVDPIAYIRLDEKNLKDINSYINRSMSATVISSIGDTDDDLETGASVTADRLYYRMFKYQIPLECSKWHINRLLTLIRVFNVMDNQSEKISAQDSAAAYKRENERRRKLYNSKG